jgi:dTMP kinase
MVEFGYDLLLFRDELEPPEPGEKEIDDRVPFVRQTHEPGGTDIGEQIRNVVHSPENTDMHPTTEVLLYMASRAQHVAQVIRPHLMRGGIVLCDRYSDSSLAYQGHGHQLDLSMVKQLNTYATSGLKPDITLYFEIDPEEGLHRRKGQEFNRLDAHALDFHRRVREGYRKLIAQEPERWVVLDGARPVEEVQEAVRREVMTRLAVGKA